MLIELKKVVENDTYRIDDGVSLFGGGLIVSRTLLRGGQQTRGHSHPDQEELYLFSSAECAEMIVGGDKFTVRSGGVIYVPAGYFHQVKNLSEVTCVFVTFFPVVSKRPSLQGDTP